MSKEFEDYKKAVTSYARDRKSFTFNNKGASHASVVIGNLLRTAKKEIKIYSGSLNSEIYDLPEVFNELEKILESSIEVVVIVDSLRGVEESNALQLVREEANRFENVTFIVDQNEILATKEGEEELSHFIVADKEAFRLEENAQEYKAVCDFNNKEVSGILLNVFSNLSNAIQE
jgi:hypothetical protein